MSSCAGAELRLAYSVKSLGCSRQALGSKTKTHEQASKTENQQLKNTSDVSHKRNQKGENSSTHEMKNLGFSLRSNTITLNPWRSPPSLPHLIGN
jgi:hypothetical protein